MINTHRSKFKMQRLTYCMNVLDKKCMRQDITCVQKIADKKIETIQNIEISANNTYASDYCKVKNITNAKHAESISQNVPKNKC